MNYLSLFITAGICLFYVVLFLYDQQMSWSDDPQRRLKTAATSCWCMAVAWYFGFLASCFTDIDNAQTGLIVSMFATVILAEALLAWRRKLGRKDREAREDAIWEAEKMRIKASVLWKDDDGGSMG